MKRQMSKLLTIVLAMLMLATIIAGCGSNTQQAPSSTAPASTQQSSQASVQESSANNGDLKEVTLKFYLGGEKKTETDNVWNAISEKFKSELNAKFEVNFIPFSDYLDKMTVLLAAGDNYDMNFDGNWLAYPQMVNKNAYLPLNDLMPQYAPQIYAQLQSSGAVQAASVNGNILCVPWGMSMNQERQFLVWRKDVADAAGLDMSSIQTVEDLDRVLHEAKAAIPDMTILKWDRGISSPLANVFYSRDDLFQIDFHKFCIDLNDPSAKLIPIEQTQAFRDMAKLAKKFYDDGIIAKNMMVDIEQTTPLFNQGQLFSWITTHEWANNVATFVDPSWAKAASPTLYPQSKSANRSPLANVMAINRNAANPERALMFLELVATNREMYDMVIYGIDGVTYKLDGDKAVVADGVDAANSNYIDWQSQWALWNPQFMRPTELYPAGFWGREAEFASESVNVPNPIDGLFFDTTNTKNEIARRDQLWEELGMMILCGAVDDADAAVDEFIAKQNAAGLDTVTADLQQQVNAYIASK